MQHLQFDLCPAISTTAERPTRMYTILDSVEPAPNNIATRSQLGLIPIKSQFKPPITSKMNVTACKDFIMNLLN